MIDRINLILKAKNITARQFAEEIGIQPSGMSHIMSGRNRPSLDFVKKVINRYPEIDIKWLTFGDGEMYAPSIVAVPASSSNAPSAATAPQAAAVPTPSTVAAGASTASVAAAQPTAQSTSTSPVRPVASTPVQPDLFSGMEGTLFADVPSTADAPAAADTERPPIVEPSAAGLAPYTTVVGNTAGAEFVASVVGPTAGITPSAPPEAPFVEAVQAPGVQMATASQSANAVPTAPLPPAATPVTTTPAVGSTPAAETPMPVSSPMHADSRQQSYVDENRMNGLASAVVPENQNLKRKKIVKVVVLYNDHSFSEYYPE